MTKSFGRDIANVCEQFFHQEHQSYNSLLDTLTKDDLNMSNSSNLTQDNEDIYWKNIVSVMIQLQSSIEQKLLVDKESTLRIILLDSYGYSLYDSFAKLATPSNFMQPRVNSLYNSSFIDKYKQGGKKMITTILDSCNNHIPLNQANLLTLQNLNLFVSDKNYTLDRNVQLMRNSNLFRNIKDDNALRKIVLGRFQGEFQHSRKWNGIHKKYEDTYIFPLFTNQDMIMYGGALVISLED